MLLNCRHVLQLTADPSNLYLDDNTFSFLILCISNSSFLVFEYAIFSIDPSNSGLGWIKKSIKIFELLILVSASCSIISFLKSKPAYCLYSSSVCEIWMSSSNTHQCCRFNLLQGV